MANRAFSCIVAILIQGLFSIVPVWQGRASATGPCPAILLTPRTLPDVYVSVPYRQRITAIGGSGRYTFTLVANALPEGLTLSAAGVISGEVLGWSASDPPFDFLIRATDSNGCFGQRAYSIAVLVCPYIPVGFIEPIMAASTCESCGSTAGAIPIPLPDALVGREISRQLTATAGEPPFTYEPEDPDELPPGSTLSSSGALTGILTDPGTYLFELEAYDAHDCRGEGLFALTVKCPAIKIPSNAFTADVGAPFTLLLSAMGGSAPYTFALDPRSSLPAGLTLSSAGLLRGAPARPGTYAFDVIATDAYGCRGSTTITATIVLADTRTPTATPTLTATSAINATATLSATPTFPTAPTFTATNTNNASPTSSATATQTASDALTATATASAASPTSIVASPTSTVSDTASPSPSPTASPTPPPAILPCTGDCDASGRVVVHELVLGVNMALGGETADCTAFDGNHSGLVDISDLIAAVGYALNGCP